MIVRDVSETEGIDPRLLRIPPSNPPFEAELDWVAIRDDVTSAIEGRLDGVAPTAPRRPPSAPSKPPPRDRVLVGRIDTRESGVRDKAVEGTIAPSERHEDPVHSFSSSPELKSRLVRGSKLEVEQVGQRLSDMPKFRLVSISGVGSFVSLDVIKVVGRKSDITMAVGRLPRTISDGSALKELPGTAMELRIDAA